MQHLRRAAAATLALTLLVSPATVTGQETFTAHVVGITDGDTLTVLRGTEQIRVRLYGIDAPEDGDDYSNRARQFLASLVFGKEVQVETVELDQYGRTVARIKIDRTDASVALVQSGLAWHYAQYAPNDTQLANAERAAKAAGINIWSLPNPLPPWEVRALRNGEAAARQQTTPSRALPEVVVAAIEYHGNRNSRIFHSPSCRYYTCKNCTAVFHGRDAALAAGYRPCKICKP